MSLNYLRQVALSVLLYWAFYKNKVSNGVFSLFQNSYNKTDNEIRHLIRLCDKVDTFYRRRVHFPNDLSQSEVCDYLFWTLWEANIVYDQVLSNTFRIHMPTHPPSPQTYTQSSTPIQSDVQVPTQMYVLPLIYWRRYHLTTYECAICSFPQKKILDIFWEDLKEMSDVNMFRKRQK